MSDASSQFPLPLTPSPDNTYVRLALAEQSDPVVGGPQLMTEYGAVHRLSFDGDVRGLTAYIDTHGTSVVDEISENGWSALLIAARQGHAPIVQLLLSINADVMKHKTARGESALSLACSWNRTAVVDVLMRWGADPTGLPQAGTSHLTTAIELNGDRMPGPVTILLEHGVFDVDETTEAGLTALFVACRMGAVGVVRTLLKAGADSELRVKGGMTPAEAAGAMCVTGGVHQIFKNHEQCLQLLEDWKVIYPVIRARSIRDTVLLVSTYQRQYTAHAPLYLKGRLMAGTPLPMVEAGGEDRERRKGKCGARGKPRSHQAIQVTAVQIKHKRMREAVIQQHVVQYAVVCLPPDVFRELRELLM